MLRRVRGGAFATPALDAEIRGLAREERALATDLVYTTLRHDRWIDAALAPRLADPDGLPPDVLDTLRLATADLLLRGTPRYVVSAWVDVVKTVTPRLAGLANAVLRRVDAPATGDPATEMSLPEWLYDEFRVALGDDADAAARGMLAPAPLWLTALRADATSQLEADGAEVTAGPLPGALAVRAPRPLSQLTAFIQGSVQPQNPSASVPVRLLAPRPGERVLELAAGQGVKTAQLAAAGADVVAVDISPTKLGRAEANLARLGLHATHVAIDASDAAAAADLPVVGAVLLDAPCSGTGTLRGHPEIKRRLTPDAVRDLARLQGRMLDVAAEHVAPGGRLVYAVCALTSLEGPEQVASFLERHPGFDVEPAVPPEVSRLPRAAAPVGSWILPIDGLDGFYLARLRRRAEPGEAGSHADAAAMRTT